MSDAGAKLERLRKAADNLRKSLGLVMLTCESLHHSITDRHNESCVPCPAVLRCCRAMSEYDALVTDLAAAGRVGVADG